MFFLFSSFSLSYDSQCVAPLKSAVPPVNMQPVYIQVMLRHGARTPLNAYTPVSHRGYWVCDSDDAQSPRMHGTQISAYRRFKHVYDPRLVSFLPNCREGDLLLEGMNQHARLGAFYQNYTESIGLFNDVPKSEELLVRCTDIERTFRSAQAFLGAFAPPQEPNEILDIIKGSEDLEVLRPDGFCKEMDELDQKIINSSTYQDWYNEKWDQLINLSTYLNLEKSVDNLNTMCDWVSTHACDDHQLPLEITPEIQELCFGVVSYNLYEKYKVDPYVFASYHMRTVLGQANDALEGKTKVKFTINSAHDSTVATMVQLLKGTPGNRPNGTERIPPYASHLAMEIWQDEDKKRYVRFVFNGELIQLQLLNNETLVPYETFLKSDYATKVYEHCKEVPV